MIKKYYLKLRELTHIASAFETLSSYEKHVTRMPVKFYFLLSVNRFANRRQHLLILLDYYYRKKRTYPKQDKFAVIVCMDKTIKFF